MKRKANKGVPQSSGLRSAGVQILLQSSFCSLSQKQVPYLRSDPVSQSFLHASWSQAEQEAACLGAKSVTLGRQPGTGLVRRQVLQPWLPLLSKPVPPCWGEAAFVPSSGCYSQDRRACVHAASRAVLQDWNLLAQGCGAHAAENCGLWCGVTDAQLSQGMWLLCHNLSSFRRAQCH